MKRFALTGCVFLLVVPLLLTACWPFGGGPSPTPTPTTPVKGDFTGQLSGLLNADIALSTDGQSLHALATDGTDNTITTFLIFDAPVFDNAVNLYEIGTGTHLIATWNAQAATGTLTYKGNSYDFNARAVTDPPIHAGLYQGDFTTQFGESYLAGWVVLPTPTESQEQRGGIINKQTGALKPAPALTAQDITSGQVVVPGLGAFMPTLFQSGKPVAVPSPTQITVTPPPMLSVSPGSFSLGGDKYCSFDYKAGFWNCTATLTNTGQSDLNWSASSNPSGVTFTPPSGILPAGDTTSVTISLPGHYYCTDSTLIFSGPVNSVSVSASCPRLP